MAKQAGDHPVALSGVPTQTVVVKVMMFSITAHI